jgi:hypothetical protein
MAKVARRFREAFLWSVQRQLYYVHHFSDVVKGLNTVAPFDWDLFLKERVYDLHPAVPLNGVTRGG